MLRGLGRVGGMSARDSESTVAILAKASLSPLARAPALPAVLFPARVAGASGTCWAVLGRVLGNAPPLRGVLSGRGSALLGPGP